MKQKNLPETMQHKAEFDEHPREAFDPKCRKLMTSTDTLSLSADSHKLSAQAVPSEKPTLKQELDSKSTPETGLRTWDFERIRQQIVRIIVSSTDSEFLLSSMAALIGEFSQVEACVIISSDRNTANNWQIGWWHGEQFSLDDKERVLQQLSYWQFEEDNQTESNLLGSMENLVREILPTKTILGTSTQYQEKTNGVILLLKSESDQWTNSEQELLQKISESMAIAISQVQLQYQSQTKTRYQTLYI